MASHPHTYLPSSSHTLMPEPRDHHPKPSLLSPSTTRPTMVPTLFRASPHPNIINYPMRSQSLPLLTSSRPDSRPTFLNLCLTSNRCLCLLFSSFTCCYACLSTLIVFLSYCFHCLLTHVIPVLAYVQRLWGQS